MAVNLGDLIYNDISRNEYLNEIYLNILKNYTYKLFGDDISTYEYINIDDALRFADILSKSTSPTEAENHKTWAQEMISLLNEIYPNNDKLKYVAGSVYTNTGNLRGLEIINPNYKSIDLLENTYDEVDKEFLQIDTFDNSNSKMYFFKEQKLAFNSLNQKGFSYSGPTSLGKSFVIKQYIINQILNDNKNNYCLIVPTKALINEVKSDLINLLKENLEVKNYRVVTNIHSIALKEEHNFILVFTPERLLYFLIQYNIPIHHLFVDEAHKISENDGRSSFYYKVITMLLDKNNNAKVTFASPNIPNPEVYLKLLPKFNNPLNHIFTTSYSPVTQVKFLIDLKIKSFSVYNQHTTDFVKLYDLNYDNDLFSMIDLFGSNKQNLIYCSSKNSAIDKAKSYAKSLPYLNDAVLDSLSADISNNIHEDYYLADLIKKGIAYHIGYIPTSIRERIEKLFESGKIKTIFCTSTLVEGVNLPADNLFITSSYNGPSKMTEVDLRNLSGRVGRIKYSTYGNVFYVKDYDVTDRDNFEERIKEVVPQQKLSVHNNLNKNQKEYIISQLKKGEIEVSTTSDSQSDDNYQLMRKTAIMLLNEIMTNKRSYIYKQFESLLNPRTIAIIKEAFSDYNTMIDDDINVSLDQNINLQEAIRDYDLCYPNDFSFVSIYRFLLQLSIVFKWEIYEKSTLGCRNKTLNELRRLRYYAVVLGQWMQGKSIKDIAEGSIEFKRNNPQHSVEIRNVFEDYDGSLTHNNIIIGDTLNTIENIILFKIANYFLRFSNEYKRQKTNGAPFSNDWFEFVEYGTKNGIQIYLQQAGFSRETAIYIYKNRDKYIVYDDKPKISTTIFNCDSRTVIKESEEIKFNMPEIFK